MKRITKMKHTKGPWRISAYKSDFGGKAFQILSTETKRSNIVAKTHLSNEADAVMIANAPEMLKELEETVIAIKDFQDNCEEAEHTDTNQVHQLLENIHCDFIKVIAKAKGEL